MSGVPIAHARRRPPRVTPRRLFAATLIGLAIAAAGCGHTVRVGADRMLRIAMTEYRLNPQSVTVAEGPLTILIHNYGRLTHNLAVSLNGQTAGATKPIAPGQDATLTLMLTKGSYLMASTLLSDEALGEFGTLKVG
jgi:hypothetical protein